MIQAYFNYPNSRVIIHSSSDCIYFHDRKRSGQRVAILNSQTFGIEIEKFRQKKYRFCPVPILNDLWLLVDFDDTDFEVAVVHYIHGLLSQRYHPFAGINLRVYC